MPQKGRKNGVGLLHKQYKNYFNFKGNFFNKRRNVVATAVA